MATIAITVSRGSIARNVLGSDAYRLLRNAGHHILFLVPDPTASDFVEAFGGEYVRIERLIDPPQNWCDQLLVGVAKALVYNATTELRDRYGYLSASETNAVRRIVKRLVFYPLRNLDILKDVLRWFDAHVRPAHEYDALFQSIRPDLLFATNPTETADAHVMKAARRYDIRIVAMPKSWDNLPKLSMRVAPDQLLVWGQALIDHAVRYQHIPRERITVVGVPQFDVVANDSIRQSREDFFDSIGVDPAHRLIVFGSEGKVSPGDPEIAEMMVSAIERGAFGPNVTLFIRPYFSLVGEERKFDGLVNRPQVVIDHWFTRRPGFRDQWDYSSVHARHFSNLMRHMDVMVCYTSTLALDAALYDRPVVHVGFDGYKKKPYGQSHRRWYDSAHFTEIMKISGNQIAESPEALVDQIRDALEQPELGRAGRQRLIEQFCFAADGKSGQRIFAALEAALSA